MNRKPYGSKAQCEEKKVRIKTAHAPFTLNRIARLEAT